MRLYKLGKSNEIQISGGYDWTIIPIERRQEYMAALEKANVNLVTLKKKNYSVNLRSGRQTTFDVRSAEVKHSKSMINP